MVATDLVSIISIHAPREGGDPHIRRRTSLHSISIHAPREGGDREKMQQAREAFEFQSTPPARGATQPTEAELAAAGISIHAPREGGD